MERQTLTEILSSKFKAGIRWVGWVDYTTHSSTSIYGKHASTLVQGADLRELFQNAQAEIERLRNNNPMLEKIAITCKTCSGSGQTELGIYKSGYRKGRRKFRKCKDCRGIGRAEVT